MECLAHKNSKLINMEEMGFFRCCIGNYCRWLRRFPERKPRQLAMVGISHLRRSLLCSYHHLLHML